MSKLNAGDRHVLRHTAMTRLERGGVDVTQICGYAGSTKKVFEGVYSHHYHSFQ